MKLTHQERKLLADVAQDKGERQTKPNPLDELGSLMREKGFVAFIGTKTAFSSFNTVIQITQNCSVIQNF